MRHFSMGARRSARQGFTRVLILALFAAFFVASTSSAALTFDLRAVSGSQVTIHNPKSVGVNQNSIGGWIEFELYALVNGANDNAKDESIHSFAGNMLSTHFGHGAVGGSMLNTGEMDSGVRRGIISPMDHNGHSDGQRQSLDRDPDLEIGGTGWAQTQWGNWVPSTHGEIIGRGDPFRVRNYEGEGAVAEFLLYRFTLRIESYLAEGLADLTRVYFTESMFPNAYIWREDGTSKSRSNGGAVDAGQSVVIHTAETPTDIAAIPEPATYLLGAVPLLGLIFARRRRLLLRRVSIILVLISSFLALTASPANAALTFDLRAVSGSQVTIHSPKSVAVTHNSVGGWVDFELWGLVTGNNNIAKDEWIQSFTGSLLSAHFGSGAVGGSMQNSGEIAPRVNRGMVTPFDTAPHSNGRLQNLDSDPDLEIGSTSWSSEEQTTVADMIVGRTPAGNHKYYSGTDDTAVILLYRFSMEVESILAHQLSDITSVSFAPSNIRIGFIWGEDDIPKNAGMSTRTTSSAVLIHTAQTPEELAAIPEPGTWALGLSGMLGARWFAKRRRRR